LRIRRFFRLVLILVGIIVLLVGVAIGLIHTPTAKRLVFAQIQKIINKQGLALDAVDFDYNLLALRISSAKVSLRNASAPELPSVFTADYVMAQIDLFELLDGRYRVKEAIITNPKVQIVVDEQGRSNIPGSNTSTGEAIDWLILKLRSTGGSLSFEDRSQNVFVNLPAWNLSIDGTQLTGTQNIQFQTQEVAEVRYGGKALNVQTIDTHLTLKDRNETLDVAKVSISTDIADLAISGTVTNLNDPSLDLAATGKIQLEPASHYLSIAQKLVGDLNVDASLKGRPNELKVTGRIKGENLTAEPIDRITVDVDVACDVAARRVQLNSFLARSPNLSVSGTADLALAANAGESRIAARLDTADLEKISKILKLPVAVASRATGDARVRWAGLDFNNGFDGNARLQFAAQRENTNLRRIPLMGAVAVRADSNKAVASIDSLAAGPLHLRGQLSLTPSKQLSGAVRLEASDTGDALRQAANWFGTTPVGLEILGAAGVDANLAGTLDHPRVVATLQANDLRINQFKDIDLEALAEYTPEQLDLQHLTLKWEEESLTASGRMDLNKPSPTLDARAEVSNASIERILASLNQAKLPVAGNLGLAAQFSGTVANPAAHLTISASDLQAYGEPLGTLSAEAHMTNQVVQLDNLSLDKLDDGQLQASGRYEMTTRTYAVTAKTSDLKVRRLLLPDGTAVTTNLSLNADGSGTLENPGGVLKLSARDLQVGSQSLGSIDIDANAADHRALITANAPAYAVSANATIGTLHPYPAEIAVRAKDTDISRLRQAKDLSGRVSAIGNASANLSDINNARIHTEVPSFRINWLNRTITNDGPIELEYANREIKISRAAVQVEDSSVRISGNLPLDVDATGELKIEGRTNLVTLSELIPPETPVSARGELNLIGSLRGNLKRINPDARITISDGFIESSMLPAPLLGLNLKAALTDGRLIVEQLDGEWASAKITGQGEVPFALLPDLPIEIPRPAIPARFSAEVQQFKLSSLTQPPRNADATVSIKIEAAASRPEIDAVEARLTFPELRLNAGVYSLQQVGTSTIAIRNGVASVEQFELKGPQTNIRLAGKAGLRESGAIDVRLEGNTDAAVIALFNNDVKATGDTRLNVSVSGTTRQPDLNGFVELQNGQAQIPDPRVAIENLQLRLDLSRNEIKLTRLEGSLNGGSIKGEGHLDFSEDQTSAAQLSVAADGVYLEFPAGLRTVSNAKLNLQGDLRRLLLSGNVDVTEGTYSDPLTIERGLFRYLESQQSTIVLNDQPSLLSRTQLDIGLRTLSPLFLNNNIARANMNAELRVLGTLEQPGLTGRIDIEEGAQINLRERKYSVDRGVITFTNERAIEPILDIAATTKASGYDITMQISGNATGKLETVLTSEPPLAEADIVSVLATGRTLEKAGNAGTTIAKEQVLSYVAGELGTSVTEEAGRALGLSQVRIEPNLIANETEPTARLTIGKDITPELDFVYSMNLRDSNDQIWLADYEFTRRFSARGLRQNDNSYRFQFQHDVLFGLTGEPPKSRTSTTRPKIRSVQFLGETHLSQKQLSSAAGLKAGKTYDFFSVEKARTQLEKTFARDDRLEARISADKKLEDSAVDLTLRVREGPKVEFVFHGWNVANDLKEQIRDAWSDGVIDGQRVTDVIDLIESQLIRDRYFGSQIDSSIEQPDPDTKRIILKIQPGIQYNDVRIAFDGVRAIKEEELQALLKQGGFFDRDLKKRKQAVPLIENLYKERGYIDVNVEPPRNELNEESKTVRIVFRVTEGPLYRFGRVSFKGSAEFTEADLMSRSSIPSEGAFEFRLVQQTQQKIQDLYRKTGYNDVAIQYTQLKDVPKSIVDVTFNIEENSQRILKDIEVEGNQNTSSNLVRTQIDLKPGDIVSYDKLSQARSNLYNTGAYSFVEITAMPLPDRTEVKPNQTAVRLIARVREIEPWQLRYGGFYDTERGPGGIIDFSNRNMLGSARVLGLQTRYDSDLHEVRTYFTQPTLRRFPLKAVFTAFQRREIHTGDDPKSHIDDFIIDRIGFSPGLEYRLHKNNVLTFGYRFEKTHTFDRIPNAIAPRDDRSRVAPLTSSFTRDTRDEPLDASHGRFTSHAFEWGLASLGSDPPYWKYFGQYFAYLPLSKPTLVPWAHTSRSRLVIALGGRLGLSKGLGDQVSQSERFFAGGGTTVRGFEQNKLGPLDPLGAPVGGDTMLVINSELRFPLFKFFDGIAFVDAGNVYPHLSDFRPFDVRASYGVGLRIRTPYVVLRLDYGLKFNPRPGEPRGKFFGSIGQAF
jgi:outer membrane protein assembly complex protein YaeT